MGVAGDLAVALGSAFAIVFLGYVLRRVNFVTATHAEGLNVFMGTISLPCVLFMAMASINFGETNWAFVGALGLARFVTVGTVVIICRFTVSSPAPVGSGAVFALVGTAGEDLAYGIPIVKAIFPPVLVQYVYLGILPAILGTVGCIFLLEYSTIKAGLRGDGRVSPFKILKNTVSNPVTASVLLGIIFNFIVDHDAPEFIATTMDLVGAGFVGMALFNCGGDLVGRLGDLAGKGLIRPVLLAGVKCILFPVLCFVLISAFGVDTATVDGKDYSLPLLGFIMNAVPPAIGISVIALDYGLHIDEIPSMVVVGTLLAGPLLFLTAQMATIAIQDSNADGYANGIIRTLEICSFISAAALIYLIVCVAASRAYRNGFFKYLTLLAILMLVHHLSIGTCVVDYPDGLAQLRYGTIWFTLYCTRILSLGVGIIGVKCATDTASVQRSAIVMTTVAIAVAATGTGIIFGLSNEPEGSYNDGNCFYVPLSVDATKAVNISAIVILVLLIAAFMVAFSKVSTAVKTSRCEHVATSDQKSDVEELLLVKTDAVPWEDDERHSSLPYISVDGGIESTQADQDPRDLRFEELPLKLYLCVEVVVVVVAVLAPIWRLADHNRSGVLVQIELLSAFLTGTRGFFLVLCFATTPRLRAPVGRSMSWLGRLCCRRPDKVEEPNEVPDELLDKTVVKAKTLFAGLAPQFKKECYSQRGDEDSVEFFYGADLVSWLITHTDCEGRKTAEELGQKLWLAHTFHHIDHAYKFRDAMEKYCFYEDREMLDSLDAEQNY